MLQGLDLAFRVGFMVGNHHWTIYGAILAMLGIAQLIRSNATRAQALSISGQPSSHRHLLSCPNRPTLIGH